jgi:hypothetical protein
MREDLFACYVRRKWRAIRAGEFLLGYENEGRTQPQGPPEPLGPNGTFMVYRKLQQHVKRFKDHIAAEAARLKIDPELLQARIVGRWPDGTPLIVGDEQPTAGSGGEPPARERLRLHRRPRGPALPARRTRAPHQSAQRTAGPRRGDDAPPDNPPRHALRARRRPRRHHGPWAGVRLLRRQHQRRLRDDPARLVRRRQRTRLGDAPDYLLRRPLPGREPAGMEVGGHGKPRRIEPPPEPFVTLRGFVYLFVPSKRACAWLSSIGA